MICVLDAVDNVSIFKSAICTHRSGMPPFGISDCFWLAYLWIIVETRRYVVLRNLQKKTISEKINISEPF